MQGIQCNQYADDTGLRLVADEDPARFDAAGLPKGFKKKLILLPLSGQQPFQVIRQILVQPIKVVANNPFVIVHVTLSMPYFAVIAAANRTFDFFGFSVIFARSQYAIHISLEGIAAFFAEGIHAFILIISRWHNSLPSSRGGNSLV